MLDELFRAVGFGLCHQLPERSFFADGYQLPVCARDTGIYLGLALSFVLIVLLERGRRVTELPRRRVLVVGGAMLASMAADGVTSYMGLRQTTNDLRLMTGLAAGWALAIVLVPMLNGQLWRAPVRSRLLGRPGAELVWMAGLPTAYVLVRYLAPLTGIAYPVLTTIAILATFVLVNLVIVTLVPRLERRAERWRDLGVQIGLAVGLTAVELAGASWFRLVTERVARALAA